MPYTFPNQRIVKINREVVKSDFLGIKNENWQFAARDLGAHALLLYLYLSSNADGYNLALSPVAIKNAIGMPTTTYRDQIKKLIAKGYLVPTGGNNFDFFEIPRTDVVSNVKNIHNEQTSYDLNFDETTANDIDITRDVRDISSSNIQINNIENQKNIIDINNNQLNETGNIYIPKVIEIKIPVPKVERKKERFKF